MTVRTEEFMAIKIALDVLSDGRRLNNREKSALENALEAISRADARLVEYNKRQAKLMVKRRKELRNGSKNI